MAYCLLKNFWRGSSDVKRWPLSLLCTSSRWNNCVQDPELFLAQKLLGWLKARGQAVVTLREIYQLGPRPIRNARMARLLMGILEEHGYVQAIKEKFGTSRRPMPRGHGAYGYELQL
jgi:hypothetical protein